MDILLRGRCDGEILARSRASYDGRQESEAARGALVDMQDDGVVGTAGVVDELASECLSVVRQDGAGWGCALFALAVEARRTCHYWRGPDFARAGFNGGDGWSWMGWDGMRGGGRWTSCARSAKKLGGKELKEGRRALGHTSSFSCWAAGVEARFLTRIHAPHPTHA